MNIPMILKQNDNHSMTYDLYSLLLTYRIIFLSGEINDTLANTVIGELLYLDKEDKKDIYLYINSPGGSVTSGLAIYDTIKFINSNVITIGMGLCASMGAVLLASGAKGKRLCLPNCEIMIHQVLGGAEGKASDIKIHAERILETKKKLNKILASLTSKSVNKINKDTNSDYFLNAHDALNYGLIDSVIG